MLCYCKTEVELSLWLSPEMQAVMSPQPPLASSALESLVFCVCWSSEEADPHLRKVKAVCWLLCMVQSGHEMHFCINPNRDLLVDSVTFGLKSLLWVKLVLRGKTLVGEIGFIKIVQNQPLRT